MSQLVTITRALLSVSDKTGLIELARALAGFGVELISTGGTTRTLAEAGLAVTPVERLTGMPEILDGRVKTLHPGVHAGLLARLADPAHAQSLADLGVEPIDLLCVSLYPFEQTAARADVTREEAIEQIDIGGPAMIRAAAKNHERVAVLTNAAQYHALLDELRAHNGAISAPLRADLAAAAFERTASYDAAIASYLRDPRSTAKPSDAGPLPSRLAIEGTRVAMLRYGENPHQAAAVYRASNAARSSLVDARQLHGKELSYNNYADAAASLELAGTMSRVATGAPAACVIKHANPCGAAIAGSAAGSVDAALSGDPVAAYGGILASSAPVDAAIADRLTRDGTFVEVILAPSFDEAGLDTLRARWASVRLLAVDGLDHHERETPLEVRAIPGGWLAQEPDRLLPEPASWTHAAGPEPEPADLRAAAVLELVARALTSNAVVVGGPTGSGAIAQFGAGAGQMDRVAACRLAIQKAGERARGAIAVSDAFFPFPDGPEELIRAGVRTIVHPGGSKRDAETFRACDDAGVTCLTTGVRRFRH